VTKVLLCGEMEADERAEWLVALTAACPTVTWLDLAAARAAATEVRALVLAGAPGEAFATAWPALGLVQVLWAGVDRVLAHPGLPRDVPLARMVDPAMAGAMAETALWATLAWQRDFFTYGRQQAESRWLPHPQRRAADVRVTVLGLGAMGAAAAATLARNGFVVHAWSRRPRDAPPGVSALHGEAALAARLPATDVLINLLPLTPETRGRLDVRVFAALPAGAAFVNLARGAHVVDADLLAALDAGHLSHAVLDVFATEPLPPEHRYWIHPRVTVLPHVAAATDPRSAAAIVAANLRALAAGQTIAHQVNRARGY
jgi:glyoxylate/hydroxypyruvate reductase A